MTRLIAELCQNHLGDREILRTMVEEAAKSGAYFCKIQSMRATELTLRERFEQGCIGENGETLTIKRPYRPEHDRLAPLDLSDDDHKYFIELCRENNVKPLTTAFTRDRVEFLSQLEWGHRSIKLASYDCSSLPLLKDLVSAGFKHLLISTGAAHDQEIKRTAEYLTDLGCQFTFLHCVTIYPTTLEEGHLNRVDYLRTFTDDVGFSEHSNYETDGLKLSTMALTKNIQWIERHFTSVGKTDTKDGPVSLNSFQFNELYNLCNLSSEELDRVIGQTMTADEQRLILGSERRQLSATELLNRDYYRGRFASRRGATVLYNWEEESG